MDKRQRLSEIARTNEATNLALTNMVVKNGALNCISDYQLDPKVSDAIISSGNEYAIRRLLESGNILSEDAQRMILNNSTKEIKNLLLSRKQPLSEEMQAKLIQQVDNELLKHYFKHHGLSSASETLLLKSKSVEVIESYISEHHFSPSAERILLRLPKMLAFYVSKRSLGEDAFNELFTTFKYQEVIDIVVSKQLTSDDEYRLIRNADEQVIQSYWQKFGFKRANEVVAPLLRRGMYDLVAEIIKTKDNLTLHVDEVLESASVVRSAYIERYDLDNKHQLKIINDGYTDEIMKVIKNNHLGSEAQNLIVKRGISQEIIAMIKTQRVLDSVQTDIINRGHEAEILALCGTQTLGNTAQLCLIRRDKDNEITTYIDRRELMCFETLMQEKPDLVIYYIVRHILKPHQLRHLIDYGTDEQVAAYVDFYYPID